MSEKAVEWIHRLSEFLSPDSELLHFIIGFRMKGEANAYKELEKAIVEKTLLSIPWGCEKRISYRMIERMVDRLTVEAREPKRCPYCGRVISIPTNEIWVEVSYS
jgi:hypothetical protein